MYKADGISNVLNGEVFELSNVDGVVFVKLLTYPTLKLFIS